jgi:archaellum component FlaC
MQNKECVDCENWKRRGDEQFDRAEQLSELLDRMQDAFDELADRLRECDEEIERLQKLLTKHNVCF